MIIVIDNFIKDEMLKREVANMQLLNNPGKYKWYDGWWNNEANTTEERLIQYIWKDNCPIRESFDIRGFEYWTGIQSAEDPRYDNNLILHADRDEGLWDNTGKTKNPLIGTIYYPEQAEFEGGMLEIYTNGFDNEPERIYAKPNRLIIFNAGDVLHRVDVVTKGTRKAIAINLWKDLIYSQTQLA